MAEPSPQPTPEKFSERPEIKALLADLKVEVEQQRVVIDEIDRRFAAEKDTVLKDAQDARLELATRLTAGMETPELVVEVARIIQEELIEGMMKAGDLKALTLTDLLDLEADQPGILLFAFTTWGEAHKDVELEHFALYTNPAAGTEMTVYFRENREAYWKVGAGNLLPPQVDVIKVTDAQGNTRIGKRRLAPRNGFYDKNGYLSIFDGYKITIATAADYTGPEPTPEQKPREVRVDVIDTTGSHTRRARRAARQWRGESGERVRRNEPDLRRALPSSWLDAGQDASEYYREAMGVTVDPAVTFAIIHAESSFNPGTPNLKGESTALGLGQFIEGTWDGFVRDEQQTELIQTLTGTDPDHMSPAERLNLRTHPLLSIYAVTWYLAKNARDHGLKEVTPDHAADLYFYYHEGPDGGERYLEYERYRATESEEVAAKLARLHIWQRTSPVKTTVMVKGKPREVAVRDERGRIVYQPGARFGDENLAHVRDVARKVERFSRQYHPQLARRERQPEPAPEPAPESAPDRSDQVAALEPYRTPAQLDRLARNPTLTGRTLLIGSSSTIGYAPRFTGGTIETEAAEGRSIVTMFAELKQMPLERLRSFNRIVLQGGVKNTDHDAPTIDTSIRTMDAMVAYVRDHAPDVKIYVLEVTPWNADYDGKIRDFNDHLNSPSFRAQVAGVIPTYAIMNNGEGRQRAAFGKPGELHVARYDRYAGVLADWVTRHEVGAESPEKILDASRVALIGDSLTDKNAGGYARYLKINGAEIPDSNHYALASRSLVDMEARLKTDVEAGKFDGIQRLAILGGANDLSGAHGLDTEGIKKTLENMVDLLLSQRPPIKPILVTLPPVLGYKGWGGNAAERQKQVEEVNDWIRQYAAGHTEVSYYDLYTEINDPDRPGYAKREFYRDGLHLSQAGSRLAAQGIERVLLS